ncbi:MAG: type II secretory pathway, pseudopilin PulG, partial [Gammaproteobacteria bacterium]|nr:type II secretory pathway, pseudopilin PulG [Gammaproteobacteria bacterium]
IVILGVLAAFALPRFTDLSSDANTSVCKGGLGAVKSSAGIAHAKWLAQGSTGVVNFEGTDYTMTAGGYPSSDDMAAIAQLSGYSTNSNSGVLTVSVPETGTATDTFTYNESTATTEATVLCGKL